MIQHTPGPFEVFREKTNQGVSYYIRKVGNGMVGEAFWNCLTKNEETAAANAALFAASPDLLRVALAALSACERVDKTVSGVDFRALAVGLRSAIDKATK